MKGDILKPPEKKPENPFLKVKKTTKEVKVIIIIIIIIIIITITVISIKEKPAPVIRSRKKFLVAMKNLPTVPGILFRGFPKLMKRNMILVQSFATLFKLICFSFPNRDTAFKLKLHEEIAEIGQVSILMHTLILILILILIGVSKYATSTRVYTVDN